jgi:hypothetical protein
MLKKKRKERRKRRKKKEGEKSPAMWPAVLLDEKTSDDPSLAGLCDHRTVDACET